MSRQDLIKWVNDTFNLNYEKVEQVSSGVVFCLIMDRCYPGKVPIQKVNLNPKFDHECVQNYKILQAVFTQQNIPRTIEVQKLQQAKYLDCLEFLQWMKKHYDSRNPGERGVEKPKIRDSQVKKEVYGQNFQPNVKIRDSTQSSKQSLTNQPSSGQMNQKVTELQVHITNLEKERDFYFSKVRSIEILCQSQDSHLAEEIKKIIDDDDDQ